MDIPNYLSTPPINPETGEWTPEWANIMQQTFTQLQSSVGKEGFKPSPLSTDEINDLVAIAGIDPSNAAVSNGSIYFDETLSTTVSKDQALKVMIDGTLYTVQLA